MRPSLSILLSLTTALAAADDAPRTRKLPAVSLLPDGSQLKGVMIPRHDEAHRLVGSLRAGVITLVNAEEIAGDDVVIDFFNGDGTNRGRIQLALATFNQPQGILTSNDPVSIDSETFHARGHGLHYAFQQGDGFITGPALTWIKAPIQTTMKSTPASLIGATGLAILTQTVAIAVPHDEPTDDPAAVRAAVNAARAETAARLADDQASSDDAAGQVKGFLDQARIDAGQLQPQATTEAKPLDVEIGPNDTVVSCDGGMYFDADEGLLVYMKNVTVKDPRFELSGANELKVFLSRKPAAEPADGDKKDPAAGLARFDDVERIIATGAVRILQRSPEPGKPPVEASGAIFTYRPKTGEIILSGGYPWVKRGSLFARAKQPNLTLRIEKDFSFDTEGSWEFGGPLNAN